MRLGRRHLLTTAMLAPAVISGRARAASPTVIRAVPIGDLKVLDPIWTTAYITRNHDFMVNVIAARQTLTGIIPGPVLFYWNTDKV